MAIVLALISAVAYGISDFVGGVISKRASPWQVAVVGQSSSTVCVLIAAVFVESHPQPSDWFWGAIAGLGGGFGAAFLYRGLSSGRMGVVAPISAIGSALVPVAVGLITGDRPSTLAVAGIVLTFPAIYLISHVTESSSTGHGGALDGAIAGLGFGFLFVFLGQVGSDAGLYPLALAQLFSVLAVILTATALGATWVPRNRRAWNAVAMGPLGASATGFFLYATHHGLLSIVSVIAALYPASTVFLAAAVLRERIHQPQAVGLAFAAMAVALVAVG
ncbi:MAG: EamA family transporter [Nocardioidaceae bacterium]|nr:EamA family transporter [Nocardioidaceae bacterium]